MGLCMIRTGIIWPSLPELFLLWALSNQMDFNGFVCRFSKSEAASDPRSMSVEDLVPTFSL